METSEDKDKRNDVNPYDINGTNFNPDLFNKKIMKEYSLSKLMETESNLIRQIQDLDSDMQTLVYENYNKFILATETIRKMKTDFKEMEDKMENLSKNIGHITQSSSQITNSLKEKRGKVSKLSGIHDLLKKLNFLFELPTKLEQHCEDKNFDEAVQCYLIGIKFVNEFKQFPSIEAIKHDCQKTVAKIREHLYKEIDTEEEISSQDLTNISLLLSLGEPPSILVERFLENSLPKLSKNLDNLKSLTIGNVSLEEFMELGCGIFLSNLSLIIASFSQAFIQTTELNENVRQESQEALKVFVCGLMNEFLGLMEIKLMVVAKEGHKQDERGARQELIKAMDRLYRRLMAMGTLMPNSEFAPLSLNLISKITKSQGELCLEKIKISFEKSVKECKELHSHPGSTQEILGSILATFISQLKSSLTLLQEFSSSDCQFAQNFDYRQKMAIETVREGFVVSSFKYLVDFGKSLMEEDNFDQLLWLLLSKLYLDVETGHVEYIINTVEADFDIRRDKRSNARWNFTSVSDLALSLNLTAKLLIKEFVSYQGDQIAQIMKKAITDSDLFSMSKEPERVSVEMRKVIEILTKLEKHLESIFPDRDSSSYLLKSERSSDSSKRSSSYSLNPSGSKGYSRQMAMSNLDSNMTTNIHKLFSERVEIFGTVELRKSEILMAIVKIGLRAMLEIVRLKTIGKFGLHQIQVDVHFLQLYLWRFVHTESFLYSLLDEVLASAIKRCVNPTLLETTMVEIIAENNP